MRKTYLYHRTQRKLPEEENYKNREYGKKQISQYV